MAESFPAKKAAHYAGLTPVMLNYLERAELFEREELRNSGRKKRHYGKRREYTFRDLVILRAIASLLDRGVSVQRIKDAVLRFARDDKFACDRDKLLHDVEAIQYFVTDGVEIFYTGTSGLVDIVKGGQGAFSFVVDLGTASKEVSALLPQVRKKA